MSTSFKILNSINETIHIEKEENAPASRPRFIETFKNVGDYANMVFNKVNLYSSEIWMSDYNTNCEAVFYAEVPDPILEAHITLKNRMVQSLGRRKNIILDNREFNVTYAPGMINRTLFPTGGQYATFDIHPSESMLRNWAEDFPVLQDFINRKEQRKDKTIQLLGQRSFLNQEMETLVYRIIAHLSDPECSRMLIDALSSELLALFLIRSQDGRLTKSRHHNKNTEALLYVRQLIEQEAELFDSEDLFSTEIQLADKAGLTIYQLKKGFRKLFGINPYKMCVELRLQKAKKLLINTNDPVLDIALKTGFQTSEGLIRAYKKLFNITPAKQRG